MHPFIVSSFRAAQCAIFVPVLNSKDLYIKTSTGLIPRIHSLQRSVYERQRAKPQATTLKQVYGA